MPIVQISRIQHRRGKRTDLPQLAAGELGWVVDDQRLYIGNGTVADGAPAVGNTEILTSGSNLFDLLTDYTSSFEGHSFFGGEKPNLVDFAAFGYMRSISPFKQFKLLEEHEQGMIWYKSMEQQLK